MAETHAGKAQAWSDPLGYLQDASGSLVSIKSIAEVWAAIIEGAAMTEIRAEEAQRMVDEGRAKIVLGWSRGTAADVQGDHGLYATTVYTDGTFYCSCPWGRAHPHTYNLCVHALAVRLAAEARGDR